MHIIQRKGQRTMSQNSFSIQPFEAKRVQCESTRSYDSHNLSVEDRALVRYAHPWRTFSTGWFVFWEKDEERSMQGQIGQQVGHYCLVRLLGGGSFGSVYCGGAGRRASLRALGG